MKEAFLTVAVLLSVVVLVLTNIHLVKVQNAFSSTLETVKSQFEASEKGIVNLPQPDYRLAAVMSLVSFAGGIGVGWLLFKK